MIACVNSAREGEGQGPTRVVVVKAELEVLCGPKDASECLGTPRSVDVFETGNSRQAKSAKTKVRLRVGSSPSGKTATGARTACS